MTEELTEAALWEAYKVIEEYRMEPQFLIVPPRLVGVIIRLRDLKRRRHLYLWKRAKRPRRPQARFYALS